MYYILGGPTLRPKQIMRDVKLSGYKIFMEDQIEAADHKQEPQRSEYLRLIRQKVLKEFRRNLSSYRALAYELHCDRQKNGLVKSSCEYIHTNMSLKHNHLYNDFARLIKLDELLSRHPDLFGI